MKSLTIALAVCVGLVTSDWAAKRFLLAADNQGIENDRSSKVVYILRHPRHGGIYDAARLPDGGIAYAHRGGLAVFDAAKKLVMQHKARPDNKSAEPNSVTALDGGKTCALIFSGLSHRNPNTAAGIAGNQTAIATEQVHHRPGALSRLILPCRLR